MSNASNRARLYDEPRYYDIAFGWDISSEVDFLEEVFRRFGRGAARSVLDLACGTGRFTLELARRGYLPAGLDFSRDMLAFARQKAAAQGLGVELFLKDMTDFALYRTFDAAICMTGSVGYISTAEALVQHLRHVAVHLVQGGLYVVDIPLVVVPEEGAAGSGAGADGGSGATEAVLPPPQEWAGQRDRIKVSARWELAGPYDAETQTATERLVLRGQERGWERVWEQETTFRLLRPQDIEPAVEAAGHFRIAAMYAGFDITDRVEGRAKGHRALVVLERMTAPEPVSAREDDEGAGTRRRMGAGRGRDGRPGSGGGRGRDGRPGVRGDRDRRDGTGRPRGAGAATGTSRAVPGQSRPKPNAGAASGAGLPVERAGGLAAETAGAKKKRRRRRGGGRREGGNAGSQKPGGGTGG